MSVRDHRIAILVVAVVALPISAHLEGRQTFEVASIKRSSPDATPASPSVISQIVPGNVWRSTNATVYGLIRALYPGHTLPGQIQGVSNWVGSEFYDIDARATPSASQDEMREMARNLLADRFKLRTHIEQRDVAVYVLSFVRKDGRLGPGLTKPAIDCNAYRLAQQRGDPLPIDPTRKKLGDRKPCATALMPVFNNTRVIPGARVRISAGSARLVDILEVISRELGRPVIDRTGSAQLFDIEVQYSLTPAVDGESGPPLKAALRDQLGLRVDDSRAVSDVLVIDHVERPDPN